MGQTRDTLPTEAACRDSMTDMTQNESVLILIKHCRDMKQQETCLRLITLLLLLSCMILFIFTTAADLRQHENSGSSGQGGTAEQRPAYLRQETGCPAENPPTSLQKPHIDLRSVHTGNLSDGQYLKWNVNFGAKYNEEKRAIEIPETGTYFVYLRIALGCHGGDAAGKFRNLSVQLRCLKTGYSQIVNLTEALDGVVCNPRGFRNVFVGQLFEFWEGDYVSVWIEHGYKLITKTSFGAYRT